VREVLVFTAVLRKSLGHWNSVGMLSSEEGARVVNGAEYPLWDSSKLEEESI